MSDPVLSKVLDRCRSIAKVNQTEEVYHRLAVFMKKNYVRLLDEAKVKRSEKRRTYGNYEGQLANLFIELCAYRCTQANRDGVNKLMTAIGYAGYDQNKARFRQRMENYLKNAKTKKRIIRGPAKKKRSPLGGQNEFARLDNSDGDYEVYYPYDPVVEAKAEPEVSAIAPIPSIELPFPVKTEEDKKPIMSQLPNAGEEEKGAMLSPSFSCCYDNLHNDAIQILDPDYFKETLDDNNLDAFRSYGFPDDDFNSMLLTAEDFDDWRSKGLMCFELDDRSIKVAEEAQRYIDSNKGSAIKIEDQKEESPLNTADINELGDSRYSFIF